jgi:hypothetical protein
MFYILRSEIDDGLETMERKRGNPALKESPLMSHWG